ncbi:MAG TPA: hypothetical protein VI911_07935 [Patescibacteria group bacterium]|nr:hypothetical protein [Patescibacteria group bacterium]
MKFSIAEKYTLALSWEKVEYKTDGECLLNNARLSGPALSIANKINPNEFIKLDFYKQYLLFVKNVYIAKLSWGDVVYNKNNTVTLKEAKIVHDTELNRVPQFKHNDFILIDTSNHEDTRHAFSLVYTSYVVDEAGNLYNFRG